MHKYRSHSCNELNLAHIDNKVKLSGWIHRKRNHGNLIFVDLRDHFGITQLIFSENNKELIELIDKIRLESVITVVGKVIARSSETKNLALNTGEIEIIVEECIIESAAEVLPISVNSLNSDAGEELRLRYRFLDLRHEKLHKAIILRSEVVNEIRKLMLEQNFIEFQTPILTASSPEGARDFLVPSRLHPGKFYALPQAPQQFKQLLMVSGFDRYFQIAPCFRDEDARADRSPGEFYQLDVEMSFVTQEDIFNLMEGVLYQLFTKFTTKKVSNTPFARITYVDSLLKYGSDKPDLRNPLIIIDVSELFLHSTFTVFKNNVENGKVVRAIVVPNCDTQPRSFFDKMNEFVISEGGAGLGYISFSIKGVKGPIAKFLTDEQIALLRNDANIKTNDTIFFISDDRGAAAKLAGKIRMKLAEELDLIEKDCFKFCWITDFPFFELNEQTNKIDFSHNPFSMPQGGLEALNSATSEDELLAINAFQYDIVCNGIELSSGAIRNHKPEIMYRAFEIAGYSASEVDKKFGGMIKAFKFGAPPHGGIAPGIDRIVMLLADAINIREVIAFPLNQQGEDLLMQAPNMVENKQLRELNIALLPVIKSKI